MKEDYYSVLGINQSASFEDVKKAFRKMALKYHPERNPTRTKESEEVFRSIAEAYEVLSDSKTRAIFDQYGEDGLKNGGTGDFGVRGGYRFSGDPQLVFEKFFGVSNPFEQLGDFSALQGTEHQFFSKEGARNKDLPINPPVTIYLECSLEEIFDGAYRVVKYDVEVLNATGELIRKEQRHIDIQLPKGVASGTVFTFPKQGTEREGWITGDLLIEIHDKLHDRYRRAVSNDLLITCDITLEQALTGFPIELTTLDNRKLNVFINDIVHPLYTKIITGEGMPTSDGPKADMCISFNIAFPNYLSAEQQRELKRILNANK
jgi:DnaJ-class molecular chaperone